MAGKNMIAQFDISKTSLRESDAGKQFPELLPRKLIKYFFAKDLANDKENPKMFLMWFLLPWIERKR